MKNKKCCICKESYMGYGNNPNPVKKEGRCCNECNNKYVLNARMINYIKNK